MQKQMTTTRLVSLSAAVVGWLVLGSALASAAEWGTLTGKLVYDGKAPKPTKINADKDPAVCAKHDLFEEGLDVADDGGLANAFVYLRTKVGKGEIAPDYEKTAGDEIVLDNKDCRFEPHALVLRTSQKLAVKNSDPVGHNSKVEGINNPGANPIIPSGQQFETTLGAEETLPIKVGCNIHPWMGAVILVRDNPYAVVTSKDGSFEIKDLPVGKELEFQLWQEKAGFLKEAKSSSIKVDNKGRFKIKIQPGANDLGTIKIGPKQFNK